jgi:uncharacterized protein with GYD domain
MATFVLLSSYTDQGVKNVRESPTRVDAFKKAVKSAGGEVRGVWLTMGRFDTLCMVSAPDDETMARISLSLCALGNVHTETIRAFGEEEMRQIISKLTG